MSWWNFGKKKVGLVLGGGVARGLAHIGVLRILEKYKIPIHYIAAVSSGSMVGSFFAAGMPAAEIEEIGLRISWGKLLKLVFFRPGLVSTEALENLIKRHIGDIEFSDLKIPFATVAADIRTGNAVVLRHGKVAKAVAASSAFPGFFAPEHVGNHILVDGGLSDNLPVDVVIEMGANFVLASDVIPSKPISFIPKDAIQVFGRSVDIMMHNLSVESRKKADVLIEPYINEDVWQLDLHKAKHLIAAGEFAAHKLIKRIKFLIES